MESGQGSVRRNIALKLKEPAPSAGSVVGSKVPTVSRSDSPDVLVPSRKVIRTSGGFAKHRGKDLAWDQRLNLIGRAIHRPLIHICEVCDKPILIYGRMKRCRHAFCRDCIKQAGGECPKCHEANQLFEEASMGNVHICSYGGGRYDNKGCGRSYLSQRDLEAHIAYRHKDKASSTITPLSASSTIPQIPLPPFFAPPPNSRDLSANGLQPSALPTFPQAGGLTSASLHPSSLTGVVPLPRAPIALPPNAFSTQSNTQARFSGSSSGPPNWSQQTRFP